MLIYKQTKQELFTNEVNKILTKLGKYQFEYIAPCSIDKINNICTSVNDYTLFTDRYVEANLIDIDPTVHWVTNTLRPYVSFDEFELIDDVKITLNGKIQIVSGIKINKHRKDCKINSGFCYIERHIFHNYLIMFGTKNSKFDIFSDIFSIKEKYDWLHSVQTELIKLMADMNSAVFSDHTSSIIPNYDNNRT